MGNKFYIAMIIIFALLIAAISCKSAPKNHIKLYDYKYANSDSIPITKLVLLSTTVINNPMHCILVYDSNYKIVAEQKRDTCKFIIYDSLATIKVLLRSLHVEFK